MINIWKETGWGTVIFLATLSGIMASELGENVQLAKRAGLLHDIGKSIDKEVEGTHAGPGAALLHSPLKGLKVILADSLLRGPGQQETAAAGLLIIKGKVLNISHNAVIV